MREYLFDDSRSILHSLLGAGLAILVHLGFGVLAAVMFVIFLLYQLKEFERPVATIGDVFEAVIGYLIADMAIHSTRLLELLWR